jgi:hypothetical protein
LVDRKSELEIELADQVELFEGARGLRGLQGKEVGLASMNNAAVIRTYKADGFRSTFKWS